MNQIRKLTMPVISEIEKILNRSLDNVYLNTALKVFLVLYAALAAPQFPPKLAFLMDNIFVRIGISFLIVFMALRDPGLALIIAIAFVITLQTANKLRLINTDLSQALQGETSWLPSAQREGFATEGLTPSALNPTMPEALAAMTESPDTTTPEATAAEAATTAAEMTESPDAAAAAAEAAAAKKCAACQDLVKSGECSVTLK